MIYTIILIGFLALLFLAAIGAFTLVHLFRSKKEPADTSNRINHIRLWWFALTRENLFVDKFPWLKNDELDNVER